MLLSRAHNAGMSEMSGKGGLWNTVFSCEGADRITLAALVVDEVDVETKTGLTLVSFVNRSADVVGLWSSVW